MHHMVPLVGSFQPYGSMAAYSLQAASRLSIVCPYHLLTLVARTARRQAM